MAGGFGKLTPDQVNAALAAQGASYRVPVPGQVASVPPGTSPVSGEGDLAFPDAPPDVPESDLAFPNAPEIYPSSPALGMPAPLTSPLAPVDAPQAPLGQQLYTNNPGAYTDSRPNARPVALPSRPGAQEGPVALVNPFTSQGGGQRPPEMPQRRGPSSPASPYGNMAKEASFRAEEERIAAEGAEAGVQEAVAGQQQALRDQAKAQEEGGKAQEALLQKASALQQRQAQQVMEADADQAKNEAKQLEEMNKDAEEIGSYEVKDRRTAGQRAMSAIAIGLGEIGSGITAAFTGQRPANAALGIINAGIDRDLQTQEATLANKRTALGAKQTALGIAQARYKDATVARQYAQELETAGAIKELEAAKAKMGSSEARAVADGLISKLSEGLQSSQLARHQALFDKENSRAEQLRLAKYEEQKRAAAAGAGGKQLTMEQLEYLVKNKQATADQQKSYAEARNKLENEGKGAMSDGDKKLARLAAGVQPAVDTLLPYLQQDGKDIPYFNVAKGAGQWLPDALLPKENLRVGNSINAVSNVLLRDESGASLPPAEIAAKKASWGIDSGDPEIRKEGAKRMLYEFEMRKANGTLPPDVLPSEAAQKVRRGAAK